MVLSPGSPSHLVARLRALLATFPRQHVVGVGDLMLDQYRRGKAVGLSPEAPAVELLNPGLSESPGGAANVARNIGFLGGTVQMIGVVGADRDGARLRDLLEATPGVNITAIADTARPTTVKLRYYHDQFQVLRVSSESREPLAPETAQAVCRAVETHCAGAPVLFVEDYGKQLVNENLVAVLLHLRRVRPELTVILDPKIGNHHVYRPGLCSLLKPNWKEACALVGMDPEHADSETVAHEVSQLYDCDVLITLGSDGSCIYERAAGRPTRVPTRPREAFDVAGAGDTSLAAASLTLAAGASLLEAAILANVAGGIAVEKSGTAYVTPEEIAADLEHPKTMELLPTLESAFRLPASIRATSA